MTATDTRQLRAWKGDFGTEYTRRNDPSEEQIRRRTDMWRQLWPHFRDAKTILEVGANVGANLEALSAISNAKLFAIEPNDTALDILGTKGLADGVRGDTALDIGFADGTFDLVFTSGVLIHIHPEDLLAACSEIHRCSRKYVLSIEYFSDQPVSIEYRKHGDLLFKRDFGSFWLDNFTDLSHVANGFFWRRTTGLDNLNWWLFRKDAAD